MKVDIENRAHIELLVNTFYGKVRVNKVLGYIFNDIAKVDWETHLPKMYAFWSSILIGEQSYSDNPMIKHIALSKITPISDAEFSEWLRIFNQTVDELFEGPVAVDAKFRAANIARLMLHKIKSA